MRKHRCAAADPKVRSVGTKVFETQAQAACPSIAGMQRHPGGGPLQLVANQAASVVSQHRMSYKQIL